MTTKVKTTRPEGSYNGNYGQMFVQFVELEDGTTGEVAAKTENKWQVGDEVEYQIKGKAPNGNNKLRLSKPDSNFSGPSSSAPSALYNGDREKEITAGMISNQIVQLWAGGALSGYGDVSDQLIQQLIDLNNRVKGKL